MLTYPCTTFPSAFLVLTSPPYPTAAFTVLPHCLHCLIPAVAIPYSSLSHPLAGCLLKDFSDTISPTGHSSTSWAREGGLPRIPQQLVDSKGERKMLLVRWGKSREIM